MEELAIPLCLVGLILMYFDRTRLLLALRSYSWKPTQAVVTDFQVTYYALDSVSNRGSKVTHHTHHGYTFDYCVQGLKYRTQNVSFGVVWASYEVGDEVTLYVDPRNPEQAVVRRGIMPSQLISPGLLLLGVIYALISRL